MNLITKFNLILIITFGIGLAAGGLYSYKLTQDNALTQVTDQAELIMQQALAVRSYTVNEVRPLPGKGKDKDKVFHPQTVPAYSATQTANIVRKQRPDYSYKEAVIDPTNPRNKAESWEKDIINKFIKVSIVLLLSVNGVFIHKRLLPKLATVTTGNNLTNSLMESAKFRLSFAFSFVGWLIAAFYGVAKFLNHGYVYAELFSVYLLGVSLLFVFSYLVSDQRLNKNLPYRMSEQSQLS